ncbi:hypothetical protein G6F32_013994 [Rhizopus arrhizus]|nr:hypothetical protein G6F32_013994 [Rhizopus arrhizus]
MPRPAVKRTPALDQFTTTLPPRARDGKLDPVIGRDGEIRQVIDILMRRRQNNPILTGEAGVGKTAVVAYDPAKPVFGPAGSADVVLTFRNVHNWRKAGQAQGMFQGFFNVLKPGGVLGVVERRAKADVADDDDTGYVGQQQ